MVRKGAVREAGSATKARPIATRYANTATVKPAATPLGLRRCGNQDGHHQQSEQCRALHTSCDDAISGRDTKDLFPARLTRSRSGLRNFAPVNRDENDQGTEVSLRCPAVGVQAGVAWKSELLREEDDLLSREAKGDEVPLNASNCHSGGGWSWWSWPSSFSATSTRRSLTAEAPHSDRLGRRGRRYNLPRFLTPRTSEPGAARRTPRKANVLGPSPGGYENSSIDDKVLAARNLPCMWKPHKLPAPRMRSWYSTSTPRPEFEMPSREVTKTYPFEKL